MTSTYIGFIIDNATDNYTLPYSDLISAKLVRKVNSPTAFQFEIHNPAGARNSTYEMDDTVDVHVGTEPLMRWGSVSALSFDGSDDYIDLGTSATFNPAAFTIIARVYVDPADDGEDYGRILALSAALGAHLRWRTGTDKFEVALNLTVGANNYQYSNAITTAGWYHVAMVADDTQNRVYINAVEEDSDTWSSDAISYGDTQAYIGGDATASNFKGKIDEVKLYDAAKNAAFILADYGGTHSATDLVGYWDFDEGYGSTATDESTNSNDGTISGASWVNPKVATGLLSEIVIQRPAYGRNLLIGRGEDYLTVLSYRLARGGFPGAVDISTVLTNLLTEFASGEFTTTNVVAAGINVTDFTVGTRKSLLNIMRELAELPSGDSYDFYLDGGNDLHWHKRAHASYDSGVTIDEDNIRSFQSRRSTKDKKTFIHIFGASEPVEETAITQSTVTDSVTLDAYHYADDFIAEHDYLHKIALYIDKVGSPGTDFRGRIALAKNDSPAGDFKEFSIREEDVSGTASWHSMGTDMPVQVGQRYFVKLDKVGANSSNTYRWYGDTPAVLDTLNQAQRSPAALKWAQVDYDMSMKIYYGNFTEVSATDAGTPKREAVVMVPKGVDDVAAQALADRLLVLYLQTEWFATVTFDAPSSELKPADLITLNEAGSGLASKAYRMESIAWDFGVQGKAETVTIDISSILPYEDIGESLSKVMDSLIGGGGSQLESGDEEGAEPDRIGRSTIARSLVAYDPR